MPADITAVREHLFAVLEGLKAGTVDVEKARAINDTAQTLVNTAKVEIDFLRTTNAVTASGFFPAVAPLTPPALPHGEERTGNGVKHIERIGAAGTVTTHRMR